MIRRTGLVSFFLLIAALLRGPIAARAQPQAAPVVAAVRFAGRMNVPEETLRNSVSLKPGDPFSPARLEADRRALLALGFFRRVAATQETTDGKTTVTFTLLEWPSVTHVQVSGNTVVERRALQEIISTRPGQVLSGPQLQDDIRAIERLYRERGYVARVSEKIVDEAARSGILRFEILEVKIDELRVEGGTPELQDRLRRSLTEVPGAFYRPELVAHEQRRLLRARGVVSAEPRVETIAPGKVRIRWLINLPSGR
jgi:outer membrane protein insertion porin family